MSAAISIARAAADVRRRVGVGKMAGKIQRNERCADEGDRQHVQGPRVVREGMLASFSRASIARVFQVDDAVGSPRLALANQLSGDQNGCSPTDVTEGVQP
jgi:hypothetical protein